VQHRKVLPNLKVISGVPIQHTRRPTGEGFGVLEPTGDLTDAPLMPLLQALTADLSSGVLTVTHPFAGSVRLWLRYGEPVLAERRDAEGTPRPALLRRLTTAGLVDAPDGTPVEALLAAGTPGPRRLAPHVTELLLDAVTDAAGWPSGRWTLDTLAPVPPLPPLPIAALVAAVAERNALLAEAAGAAGAVPTLAVIRTGVGADLAAESWAVVCRADGVRTTADLAAACGLTLLEAIVLVAELSAEGILRSGAAPIGPPVVVPAPRRAPETAPLPLVDDLQVITSPSLPPLPPLPPPAPPSLPSPPSLPAHGSDTAAFLRELSGLVDEVEAALPESALPESALPEPLTRPDPPADADRRAWPDRRTGPDRRGTDRRGKAASDGETGNGRRRLFGR
jgi:hypothetical protein